MGTGIKKGGWNRALSFLTLGIVLFSAVRCAQESTFYSNVQRSEVFTQLYATHDYDFLWVLDNSGSMTARRQYVRDNMQNFINIMNSRKAVNFQMAVTTTDYFTTAGALIQNTSGLKVVKSATSANPVADMASIINAVVDTGTSFWEQGLESAYQSVNLYRSQFSRSGIPLVLIFVTDENDYSCQDNCFGVEPENNPNWTAFPTSRYVNYFRSVKAAENATVEVFPVVGKSSAACSVASFGARYDEVVAGIGGVSTSGSICLEDLAASFNSIASTLADRGIRFPLSVPADMARMRVLVNGQEVPFSEDNGWVFEGATNSIVFTGNQVPANGATILVTYTENTN